MIKKIFYCMLIAATAACSSTKGRVDNTTQDEKYGNSNTSTVTMKDKATSNNTFWGLLLGEACRESNMENICLSPLSAQFAMAMVANGAEGNTKQEIYTAMQLGDSVNERCRGLLDNISTKTVWSKHSEVKIANSIWVKDGFDVKKDFIETNRRYFDALVEMAEFNKQTIGHINDWCSENTNGKIPSIIDRFNDSDRMLLINALYFKAAWSKPFDENNTTNKKFTTEKGKEIKVPTMMMRSNEQFYSDEVLSIVSKRLQAGYNMFFVLPNEGVKCDVAAEYLAQNFDSIVMNMNAADVTMSLPKFTTDFRMSLKPILENLGIKRAFGNNAQFGGISDEPLSISDVVQKTYINVNEKGTEAAAVTVAVAGLLSARAPKIEVITFDRPFLYAIVKSDNSEVFFAGKVGNPNEK